MEEHGEIILMNQSIHQDFDLIILTPATLGPLRVPSG